MKKSTQDQINDNLDVLLLAQQRIKEAAKKVNKKIQRLTGAKSSILNIYKEAYKEQLEKTRKNLR